jgi:hypothetical protein
MAIDFNREREGLMKRSWFSLIVVTALLVGDVQGQTALEPPQPAPKLYVTNNYGLVAKIPNGLTYCPLPEGWVGSDHGTVLFLKPPSGCFPSHSYPSSSRPTREFAPAIDLYYGHNVSEIDRGKGESSPPRTSTELAKKSCHQPYLRIPPGLKLLGKPAVGCRHDDGDRVEIALAALYWSGDEGLIVTLSTTRKRLSRDLPMLAKVASAISVCKPDWDKSTRAVPACPDAPWW